MNFEYDFLFEHTYTFDGAFDVSVSLLYLDESGIQIVVTDTLEICVLLPRGTVTGAVTELTSGSSLIGATVSDVTNAPASLGSFPNFGDNNFVIDALPGLRTIRVEAQGFDPVDHQVMVTVGETSTQDFQLSFLQSDVNIFLLTIPIGDKPGGGASQVTMLPAWIEALFKGVVVQTSSVRVEFSYVFINLPIGKILFRAESSFYDVGEKRATNGTVKRAGNNRDNAQIKNIKIPADVPEARAPAITGTIQGVVDDGVSPVRALVSASFDFDGEPVVDGIDSDPATGIYVIPLVPSGAATVVADDNSNRSLVVPTTVVGGEVVTENLTVFPFDAENANFAPFVLNGPNINIAEEGNHSFSIDDFSVTDLDDTFSIDHTFLFHSGFGYTLSEVLSDSTRVTASLDFNGVLHIPVTFSDGISTSAPFDLTINVSPTVDPIVFVDFDTGEPAPGGTGGVDNPLLSIVDALPAVSAGGTILISGITPSSESPLVIDQAVTLQNNNPGPEPVIIDPNFVPLVRSLPETGFVTREGRPRVER